MLSAKAMAGKGTLLTGFHKTVSKHLHVEHRYLHYQKFLSPFSVRSLVTKLTPLTSPQIRTSITMVTDMTGARQQYHLQAERVFRGRELQTRFGLRCASSNSGLTGMSSRRKWMLYLGAVLLVSAGSTGAWIAYKVYDFRKRGVSLFYIPKLSIRAFGPWGTYRGVTVMTDQLESIERAQDFVVRPDDVFVISFPRSGTTWTQETVYMICNNADEQKAGSDILDVRFPYLEQPICEVEKIVQMESPRFIKSHLPYHMLPPDFHKKKPKMIYVMRNPKDVVVSSFHLWIKLMEAYRGSFPEYCELFLQDKLLFAPWVDHVKAYWERRNDDNVLFITYEDMVTNFSHEVEKISKFLNKPLSAEQMSKIVNHCSFESMKNNDMVNFKWLDKIGYTNDIGTSFIRKGKVGDWKNYFTPELDRRLMEKVERPLEAAGLKVKYDVYPEDNNKP